MPGYPSRHARPTHDASCKGSTLGNTPCAPLRSTTCDLGQRLDFASLERIPATLVTERLGQRFTDMLWRIRTLDEGWLNAPASSLASPPPALPNETLARYSGVPPRKRKLYLT